MEGNPEKIQNVRTAVGRNKKEQREGRGTVRVIRQWAVQFGTSAIEATAAESPPIRGRRSQITGWRRWSNRLWAITENMHTPSPLLGGYRPGVHRTRSPGTCSAGASVGIGTIPSVASDPTTHNQPSPPSSERTFQLHCAVLLCWTAGRAPKKAVVTGTISCTCSRFPHDQLSKEK